MPRSGQRLALGMFGIPARHGKRGFGPQADRAAELAGEGVEPIGVRLQDRNHRRMGDKAFRSGCLESRAPQQRPRFKRSAILGKFDQRSALAGPDNLDEAEAVDRGPFERLK